MPVSRSLARLLSPLALLATAALLAACQSAAPEPGGNRAPEAVASATPTSGAAPLTVAFDASGSSDPDGTVVAYAWEFGDGSSAGGVQTSHTFGEGTHTVTLTVTDSGGAEDSDTLTIDATGDGEPTGPTDPDDPDPGDDPTEPGDPGTPTAQQIAAGVTASGEARTLQEGAAYTAVDAVVTATQLSGSAQLVTSGTLTIDPAAPQGVRYDPEPNDLLRVVGRDGSEIAFAFTALSGDVGAPSIDAFLQRPHALAFQLTSSEGSDVEIVSQRSGSSGGGSWAGRIRGLVVTDGTTYQIDLTGQGQFTASAGSASEYESAEVLQGSVTAPGLSVEVNERHDFRYFQFENAVEIRKRTIDNRWTVGGATYRLADGFIKRNFTCQGNGATCGPDELDLWAAQGTLTRDGTAIGGVGLIETQFSFDTVLQIGSDRVVIYSDNKVVN